MATDSYTVWLSNASFSPAQEAGFTQAALVFLLLTNNQTQAQIELTIEAQSTSPLALIQQGQQALTSALQGWIQSLSSGT